MNCESIKVQCPKFICREEFDLPLSEIKKYKGSYIQTNDKYYCPHCGDRFKNFCDIDKHQELYELNGRYNGDEPTSIVECLRCRESFDLLLSAVKDYDMEYVNTNIDVTCPHCNHANHRFIDIAKEAERINQVKNPQPQQPKPVLCLRCNSNQFYADKKGFSLGKAVAGGVLLGNIGLLAGMHGSKKIELHCLSCGHTWKPGT